MHLLLTLGGVILGFALAPANAHDLKVGEEILVKRTGVAARLLRENRLNLLTIPRSNQKQQLPKPVRKLFNAVRQIIETVNGQLTKQFKIETNHAHTF